MDPAERMKSKILTRAELMSRRKAAAASGRVLVQCHGCFDIVHPGHVRHLQYASKQGEVLLVTLTADSVMSKGTGRPLIPQDLRAENLAALDCVDWVYINPDPTAETLLEDIKPDIYIKGREYESNCDPRFLAEKSAVERHGGRIVFSSGDVVFSSTALVAAMENSADPFHARLRQLIDAHGLSPARLDPIIESFAGVPITVIGETIIDTYILCDRPDVASESPVMSLRPLEHRSFDGGAAVIARHLAAMGAQPTLVTALPRTPAAQALRERLEGQGIDVLAIDAEGPLLEKQRFLVGTQKVMKLDMVHPITLDAARRQRLIGLAEDAGRCSRAAIVADFGNGMLTSALLGEMCSALRPIVEFLAGDVSGRRASLLQMRHMDLLTPTESELRDAIRDYDDSLNAAVWRLFEATGSRHAFVTMGADGLIAFERLPSDQTGPGWSTKVRGEHVPALAPHALDTLGCGDALLAAATLAMTCTPALQDGLTVAAFLASVAAGVEAQRLGNDPVSARDLRTEVRRLAEARLSLITRRATDAPGMKLVV